MGAAVEDQVISTRLDDVEEVFKAHHARVLNAAYRITGSLDDAEDVTQTVFMRLVRQKDLLRDVDNLGSYLYRAAVNAALDMVRARQAGSVPLDDVAEVLSGGFISQDRSQSSTEIRAWLSQALAKLNPRAAGVFALRYLEEYSNTEIAKMTKTSQAMVAVILHRARTQLKKDYRAFMRSK